MTDFVKLTPQSIIDMSKSISDDAFPAIYYLIHDNQIVYVGQSNAPLARIAYHISDPQKAFDRYYIQTILSGNLNDIEAREILRLKPIYNRELPSNNIYASAGRLKRLCCCNKWAINKYIKNNRIQGIQLQDIAYYKIMDFRQLIDVNKPELIT